jgi:hypothetical protein
MAIKDGLAKKNEKIGFTGLQTGFSFVATRTNSANFSFVASFLQA